MVYNLYCTISNHDIDCLHKRNNFLTNPVLKCHMTKEQFNLFTPEASL